jgi:hypothetical protein
MAEIKKAEKSEEELYVSPTSDDSLAERYAKVKAQDEKLSTAERLKKLRAGTALFEEMAANKPKTSDES